MTCGGPQGETVQPICVPSRNQKAVRGVILLVCNIALPEIVFYALQQMSDFFCLQLARVEKWWCPVQTNGVVH